MTSLQVMTIVTAASGAVILAVGVALVIRDEVKATTRTDALAAFVNWLSDKNNLAVVAKLGDGMTNLATALTANLEHQTSAPAGMGTRPAPAAVATPQGTAEEVAKAVSSVAEALPKLASGAQLALFGTVLVTVAAALAAFAHVA